MSTSTRILSAFLLTATVGLAACDEGDDTITIPEPTAEYRVQVIDETFVVRATTQEAIDGLDARLASGEEGVIIGELAAGDGGFNDPWSWHLETGTVGTPDVATEVCDGRPSMVEEDLDYWLNTVERYCPWSAVVVERL